MDKPSANQNRDENVQPNTDPTSQQALDSAAHEINRVPESYYKK